MNILKSLTRKRYLFISGLVLGALIILITRFFSYNAHHIHYHANFAVYINGQREEFKDAKYYQEVTACIAGDDMIPTQRVHMHMEDEDKDSNSVVHVHDHAATWGQFFENLGWILGPNFIQSADKKIYTTDENNKLHIIFNGQDYTDLTPLTNVVIKDLDRLLISYGNVSSNELNKEFKTIPSTAHMHDTEKDPASCSGQEKASFSERLHHLF